MMKNASTSISVRTPAATLHNLDATLNELSRAVSDYNPDFAANINSAGNAATATAAVANSLPPTNSTNASLINHHHHTLLNETFGHDVLEEFRINLRKLDDLHYRLSFMMKEVKGLLRKPGY